MARNGKLRRSAIGEFKTEVEIQMNACIDPKMMEKHKLCQDTTPAEYMEVFLPKKTNPYSRKGEDFISMSQITKWTNMKAILANTGTDCYKDFKEPFTPDEIQAHLGLYLLNGVSPSPRVEWLLNPQNKNPIHGKDFVYHGFKSNPQRRHKHFKAFFSCQNSTINPPPRKKYPNWKI